MLAMKTMAALSKPLVCPALLSSTGPLCGGRQLALLRCQATPSTPFSLINNNSHAEVGPASADDKKKVEDKLKTTRHFAVDIQEKEAEQTVLLKEENVWNPHEASLPHPIWTSDQLNSVKITHKPPEGLVDRFAFLCVKTLRLGFDVFSGYLFRKKLGTMDEKAVTTRAIFLETVAGVPGFAGGMIRHLQSLRRMEKDQGWIHTLLEEAENERMHLMTFLELRRPGPVFRGLVIATQWIFTGGFSLAYLISPHFCHRFVGYLEEEAVVTYTDILKLLDTNQLPMWKNLPAPVIAVSYWRLQPEAKMRDVILAIRADEAHHRRVNHTLGDMGDNDHNPFKPGQ